MDDGAQHFEVVAGFHLKDGIVGIGGFQFDIALAAMCQVEIFHGELSVPEGHHDGTVARLHGTVDNHAVAVENAGILHRVALH